MPFKLNETAIPGCFELLPLVHRDERGTFVKTFHFDEFKQLGLEADFKEEFYSVSKKGVLRGLHFQTPPHDHVKLVYCVSGKVFDAVLDLRKNSPTYGESVVFEVSAEKANIIYIPKGLAHGFYTLSDSATMMYKVSTVHSPAHDTGILWNSAGITWPCAKPVISPKDASFETLKDYVSAF